MSNELLEKTIASGTTATGTFASTTGGSGLHVASENGNGGLLNPEQSARFLDYMFDATVIGKVARTVRMKADTTEIDRIGVGEKLMKLATEGDDTAANSAVTFSKISLTTKKLRLDWELSTESLEDNIEGADLEDHIARLMATQAGNDIEDTLINATGSGSGLMSAFVGFRANALAHAHVVDGNAQGLDKAVFNSAIKTMPRKYKQRRNQLRFFTGSNLVQDYLYNLTANAGSVNPWDIASGVIRGDVVANDGGPGTTTPFAFGIPVINVPLMDETRDSTGKSYGDSGYDASSGLFGDLHLTFPQNFIVGIKRDVVVYRLFQPKKDTIEYTLFIRVGCAFENYDAHVIVKNVKVGGTDFGDIGSVSHGALVSDADTHTRGTF